MDDWRRYAGPAAFLLAVTVAVLLVRSGLEHRGTTSTTPPPPVTTTAATTTTSTTPHKAKRRYWTVRAGDSFAVIAAKTGVPLATIQQLNPTVKSTSLFIGEKIRTQ